MDVGRFREPSGDVPDEVIEAIGRASEALEYVERARGHLYTFHQLTGRADFLFEEAADLLRIAGRGEEADELDREIVGRNVLDGRWTFQVVEEYDELYYGAVADAVSRLEAKFQQGRRHVYEARLQERRRSLGRDSREQPPPTTHGAHVEDDPARRDMGARGAPVRP